MTIDENFHISIRNHIAQTYPCHSCEGRNLNIRQHTKQAVSFTTYPGITISENIHISIRDIIILEHIYHHNERAYLNNKQKGSVIPAKAGI